MKKRYIFIIALLIILFLPIPTGAYKDGGTKAYTALTYKIVDWNHMYSDGIYDKTKVYPFPINFFSVESLLDREEKNFKTEALITEIDIHIPASEPQTVDDPISGYCGNTQTTVYFNDSTEYTFAGSESVTLTDILINLDYKDQMCKCRPEYTVDTEFEKDYGISISQSYARSNNGQASLTEEQTAKIKEILLWAKEKAE